MASISAGSISIDFKDSYNLYGMGGFGYYLTDKLRLDGRLQYVGRKDESTTGSDTLTIGQSSIALTANASYEFIQTPGFGAYAGVGGGTSFNTWDLKSTIGSSSISRLLTQTSWAGNAFVGADIALSDSAKLYVEAGYSNFGELEDANNVKLRYSALSVSTGLRLEF